MTASPLGAFHLANALTYVSLLSAFIALASAFRGNAGAAGAFMALSVIADTFDGRFARLFQRTDEERALGVQLDSLSDAIAFGAAPCVCLALLSPGAGAGVELAWWTASFVYGAAAITRLAFYNLTQDTTSGFIGLPVPVAALVASSVLLLHPGPVVSAAAMLAAAAAMVLPLRIPRPAGYGLMAFVLWPVTLIALHAL